MTAKQFLKKHRRAMCDIFLRASLYLPASALSVSSSAPFCRDMIALAEEREPRVTPEGAAHSLYLGLFLVRNACAQVTAKESDHLPLPDLNRLINLMQAAGYHRRA